MSRFKAAVCQMDSGKDPGQNLHRAEVLIKEAAANGALLAVLPETMTCIGRDMAEKAEDVPGETSGFLSRMARENSIWIAGGSFLKKTKDGRRENTMLLTDPDGQIVCSYSKLHMFDVDVEGGPSYFESDSISPGRGIVTADTSLGTLGFAICYDIRFPEMFRKMALLGADIICVPASFTAETGRLHWEVLLRARAIENGVYILASDQTGIKETMSTYGHSLIIDPWGNVIADAGEGEGCIFADIDTDNVRSMRAQIPVLKNLRTDIY